MDLDFQLVIVFIKFISCSISERNAFLHTNFTKWDTIFYLATPMNVVQFSVQKLYINVQLCIKRYGN
jgi:hypothetical protein